MPRHPDIKPGPKAKKRHGPKKKRDDKSTIVSAEREAEILSMRRQGWSLSQIGQFQEPKLTEQRVGQIIAAALERKVKEPLEHLRKIELDRLDEMLTAVYPRATDENPDYNAVDRVLKIMERRAAIAGLNAPIQTEEVGVVADAKASLLSKLSQIGERLAARQVTAETAPVIDVTPQIVGPGEDG